MSIGRVCLLCLLLWTVYGEAIAQKMKVESFVELSQAEDPDAKDPTFRREDKQASRSGRYCAIIKLVTTVQDKAFTFDLGTDLVPEDVVYRDNGEVWVYVPAGTSKIKISHKRYGQLDTRDGFYSFKEVGIPKCQEATVYRLRLYTDFNPDEDIIKDANKFATVRFKVHPAAATIILRKVPETVGDDGILEKQMPLGIYHYRVSHPDYYDWDGTFELKGESETKLIDIRLKQAFGWITLNSSFNPKGYTFLVDGEKKEVSTIDNMPLRSGMHTIEVQHPDYLPETIQVVIQDSVEHELDPRLKPRVGRLSITTNKPGAIVSVDGKQIGVTPLLEDCEVIIGNHTVEVVCANHKTEKRTVTITEGQTTNLPITLVDMARFRFSSTPSVAGLSIDGKYIGSTPCYAELTSGSYRVKLEHKKYKTIDKTMYLDSSNPEVSLRMRRQYQQKFQTYLQPTFQYGTQMGVGGALGLYLANVNVEGLFLLEKKTSPIYWNYIGEWGSQRPIEETFTPLVYGVNVGYGLIIGTRFRLTPQVGVNAFDFKGSKYSRCSAYSATAGMRIECLINKAFGVCLVPGYTAPVYRSDYFNHLSETLPQLNDYIVGGFNLKIGFYVYE